MGYLFEFDGRSSTVHPEYSESEIGLRIDGVSHRASLDLGSEPGEAFLEIDGRVEPVWIASKGDVHFVHIRGRTHRIIATNALDRARQDAAPSGGTEILRAPMPGVVVRVAVEVGSEVAQGALLMTIESMKLETAVTAPHDAIIAEVYLSPGASFGQDADLIRFEVEASDDAENANKEKLK